MASKSGSASLSKAQVTAAKNVEKFRKKWEKEVAAYSVLEKKRMTAFKNVSRSEKLVQKVNAEFNQIQKAGDPEAFKTVSGKMKASMATLRKSREFLTRVSAAWLSAHEAVSEAEQGLFKAMIYANSLK